MVFLLLEKFIGIFSSLFLSASIFFCIKKVKKFNFNRQTLSWLGSIKQTGRLFNLTILSFSIMRVIYLTQLINSINIPNKGWSLVLLAVSSVSLLIIAMYPTSKDNRIHQLFAYVYFLVSFIWLIVFHLSLYRLNRFSGGIGLLISLIFIIGTAWLYLKNKEGSLWEIFFIAMTVAWDVYILLLVV